MIKTMINEKVYKAGYVLVEEIVAQTATDEHPTKLTSAYTPDGRYIGDKKMARFLCVKKGIRPQLAHPSHSVCSIGFSTKDGKWYGWSHRSIFGFKIGSKCTKGDCHYTPERGEWVATCVADARQMAIDFASGVS